MIGGLMRRALRTRIALFFLLIALAGVALLAGAAAFAAGRSSGAGAALTTTVVLAGAGWIALTAAIWYLFDEHVARPVENLSATLRARAHGAASRRLTLDAGRYLGDLSPAAEAVVKRLTEAVEEADDLAERRAGQLAEQRDRLVRVLSDIPLAVMLANPKGRLALYDGQAAAVLEKVAPPRLDAPLSDWFEAEPLEAALARARDDGGRVQVGLPSRAGEMLSGHMRVLEDGCWTLILEPLEPDAARPLTYDFGLTVDEGFAAEAVEDTPLRKLCLVVFDTETTGLSPISDEVVQIAAVRMINGQIVEGERFDTLVNPGRQIPAAATKVHGIDDAMVADAPDIAEAGRAFHEFCRGAVLVAHNAPFDLAFLRRHQREMAVAFDHPVLDTVLLSAALFGERVDHTLDALCDRFGVQIPPQDRHTAMGDAIGTARVIEGMLPGLEAKGITTFGEARRAMRAHGRLLEDANA
jgi:DNA polymerase-3 subunit epsilon